MTTAPAGLAPTCVPRLNPGGWRNPGVATAGANRSRGTSPRPRRRSYCEPMDEDAGERRTRNAVSSINPAGKGSERSVKALRRVGLVAAIRASRLISARERGCKWAGRTGPDAVASDSPPPARRAGETLHRGRHSTKAMRASTPPPSGSRIVAEVHTRDVSTTRRGGASGLSSERRTTDGRRTDRQTSGASSRWCRPLRRR